MTKNSLLRELSHGEQAFYLGAVTNAFMSKLEGRLSLNVVEQSMNAYISRYPILQCKIVEHEERFYFARIENFYLKVEELEIRSENEAHEFYEKVCSNGDHPDKSLMEVFILRLKNTSTSFLLTCGSHIISDGLRNAYFHNELLTLCDRLAQGKYIETNHVSADTFSIPIEDYLLPRFDGRSAEDVLREKESKALGSPHRMLADTELNSKHSDKLRSPSRNMSIRTYKISKEETRKIVQRCKAIGATVNNVLIAATLLSASKLFPGKQNNFLIRQAVNLRNKVEPNIDKNEFITAATSILTSHSVSENDELSHLSHDVTRKSHAAMEFITTREDLISNKLLFANKDVPLALHFSNLGLLNLNTSFANFKQKALTMIPTPKFGSTLPILIATVDGCLSMTTHADNGIFSNELLDSLVWAALEIASPNLEARTELVID